MRIELAMRGDESTQLLYKGRRLQAEGKRGGAERGCQQRTVRGAHVHATRMLALLSSTVRVGVWLRCLLLLPLPLLFFLSLASLRCCS